MRNHLKIIRILWSPRLFTEILLALEMFLVVQLLALTTDSASYFRSQMRFVDAFWKDGNYIYYTQNANSSLDLPEVMKAYPAVEAFYLGTPDGGNTMFKEDDALYDENGNKKGISLLHYNEAMKEKAVAAGILQVREDIDPGDTPALFLLPELAGIFPPGSVLTFRFFQRLPDGTPDLDNMQEVPYTVCGTIREGQLPVTDSASSLEKAESLTVNTQETTDRNYGRLFLAIACGEKDLPVPNAMLRLADGTDAEQLAEELSRKYESCGIFYTFSYMRSYSGEKLLGINKSFLLQGLLLTLVFISHFIGYLFISTRNKERTNALLSIGGITPARLAGYNVAAVLLILLPSVLIGALFVPLTEKWSKVKAYGGHLVMWEVLAVFAVIVLLLTFFTVRFRLKKGSTILLYRKGT